jgi:hypothetical protein
MNQGNPVDADGMRPEYDFSTGVRGKHHEQYKAGTNIVFLDPDVAKAFKDSESVNRALRLLLDLAKSQPSPDRAQPDSNTLLTTLERPSRRRLRMNRSSATRQE